MFGELTPEVGKPIAESRKELLEEIDFQVTLTRMNTELARAKSEWLIAESHNKEKGRSSGSKLEQSFKAHWDRNLEIQAIAEKNLKRAKQEYAANPKMAEQAEIVIKDWAAQELGKVE